MITYRTLKKNLDVLFFFLLPFERTMRCLLDPLSRVKCLFQLCNWEMARTICCFVVPSIKKLNFGLKLIGYVMKHVRCEIISAGTVHTVCSGLFFKARSSGESLSISVDSIVPAGQLSVYFWSLYIPVLVIM